MASVCRKRVFAVRKYGFDFRFNFGFVGHRRTP
jgi:hypothetical protein